MSSLSLSGFSSVAVADHTVWISGPGDRHQTVIIRDITKPPQGVYEFFSVSNAVVATMDIEGGDLFNHENILDFMFTTEMDDLLIDPISNFDVRFVSSTGFVMDDGTGSLFGADPNEVTTFEFVFPDAPEVTGSIMFEPIPAPASIILLGLSGVIATRRHRRA